MMCFTFEICTQKCEINKKYTARMFCHDFVTATEKKKFIKFELGVKFH